MKYCELIDTQLDAYNTRNFDKLLGICSEDIEFRQMESNELLLSGGLHKPLKILMVFNLKVVTCLGVIAISWIMSCSILLIDAFWLVKS